METLYKLAGALRRLDPALYARLQDERRLTDYIADHLLEPEFVGRELLSSRFDYIETVFEQDFEEVYYRLKNSGTLHYELLNLVTVCKPVMEKLKFPCHEKEGVLRAAVSKLISGFLKDFDS